jgi:hypothetical protein
MVQDTYILLPLWTGITILLGLFFHLSRVAMTISIDSRAATLRNRADSQVSFGRSTISFRSSDLEGVPFFQKYPMKTLQTLPYSDKTVRSCCRL